MTAIVEKKKDCILLELQDNNSIFSQLEIYDLEVVDELIQRLTEARQIFDDHLIKKNMT